MKLHQTLLDLLRIESFTGNEHEIGNYLKNLCAGFSGFQLTEKNLTQVYTSEASEDKPMLSLYGHIDTVPNQQTSEPYSDSNYIYGCGASDMKGGLAVMIELMRRFDPSLSAYDLQFVFYDAEEGPYKQNGLYRTLPELDFLRKTDLALVLEPTNNDIQTGCLGVINRTAVFKGKSGHSARPWEGENAIHKAVPFLKKLSEFESIKHTVDGIDFYEVCNATLAKGGLTRNVLPDVFELTINYRFPPCFTEKQALEEFDKKFGVPEAEFSQTEISPSGRVCLKNRILEKMTADFSLKTEAKQAWTDIAQLTALDIPAVNFGPGDPAEAHQVNEKISLENLGKSFKILNQMIYSD